MRIPPVLISAVATLALQVPQLRQPVVAAGTESLIAHSADSNVWPVGSGNPGIPDEVLARAEWYVAQFQSTFSSVMWREQYTQEDHVQQKFAASGTQFMRLAGKRQIESDMLLLWIPRDSNWIAVRDVITVDGAPPKEERQLDAALKRPEVSLDDLRALAAENGRFNIGRILRTFNEPTLTLLFLSDENNDRFTFKRRSAGNAVGRSPVEYEFVERSRPTLVRDDRRDVPALGSVWIDPDTGQVLQTFLELNDRHSRVTAQMTVRYEAHPGFDVLVPIEMRETYKAETGEQVMTVATYSDFRKFQTAARIIQK